MPKQTPSPSRRVMQLFFQLHNRGGEQVAKDLGEGLQARGYEVETVGFFRREGTNAVDDVTRDAVVLSTGTPSPAGIAKTMLTMIKHVRRTKPDAVIIHTTAAALLAAPVLRLLGVKRRIVIHHNPVGTYQSGIWVRLEQLMGTIGVYSDIVFVSEKGLALVGDWPAPYRDRARTILNGISLPSIESREEDVIRKECRVNRGELFVVSIGSLERQKNQKVIIEAAAAVPGLRLVIAGEGSLRDDLEKQARDLDAPVTFLGKVDRDVVVELYRHADVLAFPSLHEGRALTLLEAAVAGLPVVSSDIPENVAVLGDSARYLDAEDVDAWIQVFRELAATPDELNELQVLMDNCNVTTVDDMVDGYEELLQ